MTTSDRDLNVITKHYDLMKWYLHHVEKYPRSFKFTIGDEIVRRLWRILELLIEARYEKERARTLKKVNIELEKLRYLTRLSHEMRFISFKSYEYGSREINEVGGMVGGWLKSVRKKNDQNA